MCVSCSSYKQRHNHLGLACRLSTDDPDNFNLLFPWFLTDYPDAVEGVSENLTDDKVRA